MILATLSRTRRIEPDQSVYFDAWRGGASIVVMLAHGVHVFLPPGRMATLASVVASASVMAFFVLSGFFIHKSLASCFRNDSLDIAAFARARVNRIVLPFMTCLILTVSLYFLAPLVFQSGGHAFIDETARTDFSLEGLVYTAAFVNEFLGPTLSANGPLWSLSYEVWYYFFAGAAALIVSRSLVAWAAVPLLVAAVFLNTKFAILGLIWLMGAALSMLHAAGALRRVAWLRPLLLVSTASLFAYALLSPTSRFALTLFNLSWGAWVTLHLAGRLEGPVASNLAIRGLAGTAGFSYTLYLTHFPILLFIFGAVADSRGLGPYIALPSLVVAMIVASLLGRIERVAIFPKTKKIAAGGYESAKR